MSTRALVYPLSTVLLLAGTTLGADARQKQGADRAKKFWAAVVRADPEAMLPFYAEKVLLVAGSELLKAQWGIEGAGNRDKDLLVTRNALVGGYATLLDKVGKQKWSGIFSKIDAEKISFAFLQKPDRRFTTSRKGDLLMTVATGPGDDRLFFVLRGDDKGRWQVVIEAGDY